ncbi:hypothetical protein GCM10012287_06770 [Streptomyces daqingensis]|uniref:Uncharacterized protein n=1 Tax=Streptomyces daqingensis TaxID=1472640 RepID=A0ABQ2LUT1_9ACTN|nr:hypothetical protein GCM10012287_06770 [Streptomyces daqingensis]
MPLQPYHWHSTATARSQQFLTIGDKLTGGAPKGGCGGESAKVELRTGLSWAHAVPPHSSPGAGPSGGGAKRKDGDNCPARAPSARARGANPRARLPWTEKTRLTSGFGRAAVQKSA